MERRLFSHDKLERIYNAALKVLGRMGMKVESCEVLEAMERFGAVVDYPAERARLSKEVLDRMLEMVRSEHTGWERGLPRLGPGMGIGGGGTCPLYFDDRWGDGGGDHQGERRRASEADCIEALKIVEVSPVTACCPPVSNADCPPKLEAIRCLQLGIETLNTTMLGGTDLFFAEQVPFVAELGRLYKNDPSWFLPHGNCFTSPLIMARRIAELALAKAPFKVNFAVPTMPVAGVTAPMTPAGTAVVGVAEILGGWVLAKALNPETPVSASALSAMMDMKSGNMVYVAPEVFAADIAIVEVFELLLGLPCQTFGVYIDARVPGMRAVYEKLMRSTGLGLYGGLSDLEGTLDQGRTFSPTQLMLDCDLNQFLSPYTAEPEVSEDTLGVDAILETDFDGSYMTHEHTFSHMKEAWQSAVFGRAPWVSMEVELAEERKHLERARSAWTENLSKYEPPDHPDGFLRELRAIYGRAERVLAS